MKERKKLTDDFRKGMLYGYLACAVVPTFVYFTLHGGEMIEEIKCFERPIVTIMPSEETGLPSLFKTQLVDYSHWGQAYDNGADIVPFDCTRIESIGPMGYTVSERMPTDKEVKWYREQQKRKD